MFKSEHLCSVCKQLSTNDQAKLLCTLICLNTETFLTTWVFFILLTIASKEVIKQTLPQAIKIFGYVKNNYLTTEETNKRRGR
jgi:hypothetical protein